MQGAQDVMGTLRQAVAAIVPAAAKRRHEQWSTARYLAAVRPPTEEYVRRHGLVVRHGPFEGMRYLEGLETTSGDLVAKLAGTYEAELTPTVAAWVGEGFPHVVDVGSAEGYYAVGFAHAMPGTTVYAFDIDPLAREHCSAMAALNDVESRVVIGEMCTPVTLADLPQDGVALLADCEGYERTLLDPGTAPRLRSWTILVELHEFLDPEITALLTARFADTHDIEIIEEAPHDGAGVPELEFLDPGTRALLLSERRPARMRWAALRPRGRS
jgi:hypothetical protein